MQEHHDEQKEFSEKIICINRVAKVVKGGRRFSFSVLVVVGDKKGHVGIGLGKANEVPEAIRKGSDQAKKNIIFINLKNNTLPYKIIGNFGASKVLLTPKYEGSGIVAGGTVRAVLEKAGIKDVASKSYGSNNPHNVVKATLNGLQKIIFNKT